MKKFNLNDYILVNITEYGMKKAIEQVGYEYMNVCVTPTAKLINGKTYYKIQAHELITLFKNALWIANPCPIEMTILIPD